MWGLLKTLLTPAKSNALTSSEPSKSNTGSSTPALEIDAFEYIPLPRAPLQWETSQTISIPEAVEDFEIHDADWQISSIEKLKKGERPDPAYRQIYASDAGLFMVDDLGKAADLGPLKSSAMLYHRDGLPGPKAAFQHDVFIQRTDIREGLKETQGDRVNSIVADNGFYCRMTIVPLQLKIIFPVSYQVLLEFHL